MVASRIGTILLTVLTKGPEFTFIRTYSLLGITTTFMYAVLTGRAFSISWEHPVPFDLFFDAPHIDWSQRLPSIEVATSAAKSIYLDSELLEGRDDQSLYNTNAEDIDLVAEPMAVEWTKNNPRWIRVS